jgi:hypothetical protein
VSLQKYFDDKMVKEIFQAALGLDGSYYMLDYSNVETRLRDYVCALGLPEGWRLLVGGFAQS